jgi:hypothetical protein
MAYTKLFSSLVHSTIWREADHVRLVWITMLAISDQDGIVEASIPGLADSARVSLAQCEDALKRLQLPDSYSRSVEHEGRRIAPVEGGWELLNHARYRDKQSPDERRAKAAERQRRHRERLAKASKLVTPNVTPSNAESHEVTSVTPSDQMQMQMQIRSDADQKSGSIDPGPASGPPRAKPKRPRATSWRRVPETWQPNDEHWVLAVELRVSVEAELPKFRDHEFAKPKTDPDACFRTWLRNAAKFSTIGNGNRFSRDIKPPLRQAPNPHFDLDATVDHQWDHLDAADNRG